MAKKEKKSKKNKTDLKQNLALVILFLGVFGLSLSFAKLAYAVQNMGVYNKTDSKAKWDVGLANVSKAETKGEAKEVNRPSISNLGLTEVEVEFNKPGDEIKYTFEVKNDGTIDAKISELTKGNPTCKVETAALENRTDEQKNADSNIVCGNLEYTLTYDDGKEVSVNDAIGAKKSNKVTLTIKYKEDAPEVSGTVNVTAPATTILFK